MLVHPDHHLGDSWYFVADDGTVHAYYLVCPLNAPRHTSWDIAHATSRDLREWQLHGVVLERGDADAWDGRCLATGSVTRWGERYLMAFTARWDEPTVVTGMAASDDLYSWHRLADRPVTRPGPPYVIGRPWHDRPPTHWRDPFLLADGNELVQLICASRPDRPDDASGTVAVLRSRDGLTWRTEPPLDVEPVARELECPQLRLVDGTWFLVFSAFPLLFSAEVRADAAPGLTSGTYAMAGEAQWGPYRFVQRVPIAGPPDHPELYAGQLVNLDGQTFLLGTVWSDSNGDHLTDPTLVRRHGDRLIPD